MYGTPFPHAYDAVPLQYGTPCPSCREAVRFMAQNPGDATGYEELEYTGVIQFYNDGVVRAVTFVYLIYC